MVLWLDRWNEKKRSEIKIYKLYKKLREEIVRTKNRAGFKCKVCGSCCTPHLELYHWDYLFLKENNGDLSGCNLYKDFFIGFKERPGKPDHINPTTIHKQYGCYYENQDDGGCALTCKIHGYNPILCHGFPIVCNLMDFTVHIHKSCNFLKELDKPLKWNLSKIEKILEKMKGEN